MPSNEEKISLVAFLGNYGKQYERTRHNAAWLFAHSLPLVSALSFKSGFRGRWAQATWPQGSGAAGRRVYLLFPETYMNLSGESVAALASFYKIPPEEILAIHDEIELPFGTVSFKRGGGLGGHNGLRSLKASLGTADFWRIRIGLGKSVLYWEKGADGIWHPTEDKEHTHTNIASYVLSPFDEKEMNALPAVFAEAETLLNLALDSNPSSLLKEWGKRKVLA